MKHVVVAHLNLSVHVRVTGQAAERCFFFPFTEVGKPTEESVDESQWGSCVPRGSTHRFCVA